MFLSPGLLSHGYRASKRSRSSDQTQLSVDLGVTLSGMDVDWLRVDAVAVVQRHNNPAEPLLAVDESNQNMIKGEQPTSLHIHWTAAALWLHADELRKLWRFKPVLNSCITQHQPGYN